MEAEEEVEGTQKDTLAVEVGVPSGDAVEDTRALEGEALEVVVPPIPELKVRVGEEVMEWVLVKHPVGVLVDAPPPTCC